MIIFHVAVFATFIFLFVSLHQHYLEHCRVFTVYYCNISNESGYGLFRLTLNLKQASYDMFAQRNTPGIFTPLFSLG